MARISIIFLFSICLALVAARSRPRKGSISDAAHETESGEHNTQYDHEAFLGKEEAKEFDKLTPEESKRRLKEIVKKIDKNGDGVVEQGELRDWIDRVHQRYIEDDLDRHWKEHETTGDDKVAWDEYIRATYHGEEAELRNRTDYDFNKAIDNDKRRWTSADVDKDGSLTRDEYRSFLFPHESPRMREVVGIETLHDIDKNKDGFVDVNEYMDDMLGDDDRAAIARGEEPEWIKTQREHFSDYQDKNKDGKLDTDEVAEWVVPSGYDPIEAETQHLMYHADKDKNEKLTEDEILATYDLFVGSQATQYGEVLNRHDEF